MPSFEAAVGLIVTIIEGIGVAVIVVSVILVLGWYARGLFPGQDMPSFLTARQQLGRGLVLGLEFFVGADIIRTVTTRFSLESILVLGGIVALRTILSFSLEYELRQAVKSEASNTAQSNASAATTGSSRE